MNVLAFGEIVWDVYPDKKCLGGAPLNFAAVSSLLGENVWIFSAIGNDELGKNARDKILEWGVQSDYIAIRTDKETGKCNVVLDDGNVPTYQLMEDAAFDYIPFYSISKKMDVLYFGSFALRKIYNLETLKSILDTYKFREIFVDINIRAPFYSKEVVEFATEKATILKISQEELSIVLKLLELPDFLNYKEACAKISNKYKQLKCIIITLGDAGAYALDCINGNSSKVSATKVKVASTVGAGDGFSAAFLSKYIINQPLETCLDYASIVAGEIVSEYEAVPVEKICGLTNTRNL